MVVLGTETHVIEEIQLFETAQPVDSLTISHSKVRSRKEELHGENDRVMSTSFGWMMSPEFGRTGPAGRTCLMEELHDKLGSWCLNSKCGCW